ncbi:glycoside hydrolase family 127 protein [Segetibacter sp. 3557_3]|uniref:aceric acid hydrolase n=1 Tax=Segetibacter sp. 3557_3 TaxID=2547429 RepID=UPI001058D6BB|nr:glycoside hydrolase family 127 protein [Segetibacter sp. 3557_3]TDH27501.1 glycoside hydrolase family 127 protein [Segetibacter sp. 3557_3]
MKLSTTIALSVGLLACMPALAQTKSLVNTSASTHARLSSVNMQDVKWTKGFWADRFEVCKTSMVPNMWNIYNDPKISHAFKNFEIAAGIDTGSHKGPSFHDGDYYKTLEAMASLYASTKDPKLDQMMDKAIATIAKVQREDGYIYTKSTIEQMKTGKKRQFDDRLSFEAYNIGHLMTAACVHYRATGKTNLLDVAKKATEYLYNFYQNTSPEIARNAICPSHYMGIIEMYRTTKEPKYVELAKKLIDIRGVAPGTDDNSDRYKFRDMKEVVGHAVRANYLFAGAADLYAENGDTSLLNTLNRMWDDVVNHKMYITGGCGALYDGVSNDGTSYNPDNVEKLHQAYGRDYQLPNLTAHNETCANIGNVLWNWRMLKLTGEARYADVMELALYNSVLSGISLDGTKFLYTNPLAYSEESPTIQRWSKERVPYIGLSNCCPPNVVRTVAEVNNYAYSLSDEGVWLNLYGGSTLNTNLKDGSPVALTQVTNYPWDGNIVINIEKAPAQSFAFMLRIPGWAKGAKLMVNGKPFQTGLEPGTYASVKRTWKAGDKVELVLPMKASLIEANPMVEETRNQVAVKRGPIVYCLEAVDIPKDTKVFDLGIAAKTNFQPKLVKIANSDVMILEGKAKVIGQKDWKGTLYKEVSDKDPVEVPVKLVPYYAWGNRAFGDMSVWLRLSR